MNASPSPSSPIELRRGHPHVLERDDRVRLRVRVRVPRLADEADARGVRVEDEQRVGTGVRAAVDLRLEEDVVRGVERGHVHLPPVQHVRVAVAARGRLDRVDVGARALLGDRVALLPLPTDGRDEPPLELLGAHDLRRPGRRRADAPPETVRHPPDLLGDEHLLEHREPTAAQLDRHVHRVQAEIDRLAVMPRTELVGQAAAVHLGLDLVRDELLVDEPPGPLRDLPVGVGQRVGAHRFRR